SHAMEQSVPYCVGAAGDRLLVCVCFFLRIPGAPGSTLFPYTTLFRSLGRAGTSRREGGGIAVWAAGFPKLGAWPHTRKPRPARRSEEHTSELQSHLNLVCRLLLEKKKQHYSIQDDEINTILHTHTRWV